MILRDSPFTKIRSKGQLDYSNSYIVTITPSIDAVISYSTVIGIFIESEHITPNKVYLKSGYNYSATTIKHHAKAVNIAEYNNFKIIEGVKPETLKSIYTFNHIGIAIETVKEYTIKETILKKLYDNRPAGSLLDERLKGVITPGPELPETIQYKNGNILTKYQYRTNFKYLLNIQYQRYIKHINRKISKGDKGQYKTNTIISNIYKIQEL